MGVYCYLELLHDLDDMNRPTDVCVLLLWAELVSLQCFTGEQ